MRTVRVSAGDRDYIWFSAVEINGGDVSADTVVVGVGTYRDPPALQITPDQRSDLVQHPIPSRIRVGLFVARDAGIDDAHVFAPGVYYGWIKPTDSPSTAWVYCGMFRII